MPSNTINSVFYCPHIPQLIWDSHDSISPWIFDAVASIISPAAVLLNALVIIAVMKRRELQKLFISASFLHDVQSGHDPVYRACVLNKELRETAEQEYEFKNEYFELSDGCKEFSVALLKECHSMEEIRCVMEMHDISDKVLHVNGSLNILKFAIATGNDKVLWVL